MAGENTNHRHANETCGTGRRRRAHFVQHHSCREKDLGKEKDSQDTCQNTAGIVKIKSDFEHCCRLVTIEASRKLGKCALRRMKMNRLARVQILFCKLEPYNPKRHNGKCNSSESEREIRNESFDFEPPIHPVFANRSERALQTFAKFSVPSISFVVLSSSFCFRKCLGFPLSKEFCSFLFKKPLLSLR